LPAGVAIFTCFAGVLARLQFATPALVGNDGYYHVRMATIIKEYGPTPEFPWLPYTILAPESYVNHHFLYHLYLAIFVPLAADPEFQIRRSKIATVLLAAAAFTLFWWFLRQYATPFAWLWACGLFAVSDTFLYRMSMPRAMSASLFMLVLTLYLVLKRRFFALAVVCVAFTWMYQGFVLALLPIGAFTFAELVLNGKFEWRIWLTCLLGIGLGLVSNVYFPHNVGFFWNHLLPKLGEVAEGAGSEWYPYDSWTFLEHSVGALIAVVAGVVALGLDRERMNQATFTVLILTAAFGVLALKSRRFMDYFPAFALLFAALSISRLVPLRQRNAFRSPIFHTVLFLCIMLLGLVTIRQARARIENTTSSMAYKGAALWLATHSNPGDIVFHTDWDDFPRLFFYNTENIYISGLDPTLLQLASPSLDDEYRAIISGNRMPPSKWISAYFSASYVFTDLHHEQFLRLAEYDPNLEEVYHDEYSRVFRLTQD
jgi:hypothetical protein